MGGYFCVLWHPMVYPRPKQVRHKLITAIRPSIVNIISEDDHIEYDKSITKQQLARIIENVVG